MTFLDDLYWFCCYTLSTHAGLLAGRGPFKLSVDILLWFHCCNSVTEKDIWCIFHVWCQCHVTSWTAIRHLLSVEALSTHLALWDEAYCNPLSPTDCSFGRLFPFKKKEREKQCICFNPLGAGMCFVAQMLYPNVDHARLPEHQVLYFLLLVCPFLELNLFFF